MPPRSQVQLPTANLFTGRRGVREGHLSHEQLGALFRAARSAEERALFRLLYAYGLRVSEAGAMPLSAVHPMGTMRIGGDPATSVVRSTGEHHHLAGLFVADGSLFPTSIGAPPQISIYALSLHLSRHAIEAARRA